MTSMLNFAASFLLLFHFTHGSNVSDANDCRVNNGGCKHDCVTTEGTSHCVCHVGYEPGDVEKECLDIDECDENKGGCSHECVNYPGRHECRCPPGKQLSSDERTCVDVEGTKAREEVKVAKDFCKLPKEKVRPCFGRDYTVHQVDQWYFDLTTYECLTFRYDGCGGNANRFRSASECSSQCKWDVNECLIDNGGCSRWCVNTIGSYECRCDRGYQLDSDGKQCVDIDECEVDNGGCSDTCVNKLEGHECRCPPGTRLTSDQRTCVEASPPSARIHPKNLHAIEGETFNLTCDVDGKPTPEPIWFFNGNRLYPGAKYDMTNRNELFVRGATIHDAGVYKCWARNLAGYKSDFATVKLAVPPSVHVVQTQQLVVRGDVVSLDCRANAGSPSPKFTWSKDGRVLTTTPHLHVEEARLTIRGAQDADAGTYICKAENVAGTDVKNVTLAIGCTCKQ